MILPSYRKTQMQDFTSTEIAVLKALFQSAEDNGHDFGFIEDARSVVKSKASLGGIVSSLVKKKIIIVHDAVTTDSGTWTQFTWVKDEVEVAKILPKG